MITTVQGTTKKPVSAQRLVAFFNNHTKYEGFLYIGYPIIGTSEGPYPIDALLISRNKGLIVFNLIEGRDMPSINDVQDDIYNKLESKLRAYKALMRGRTLQVQIHPVTFAPLCESAASISLADYPICNEANLEAWLDGRTWDDQNNFDALVAVVQAISTISRLLKNRS